MASIKNRKCKPCATHECYILEELQFMFANENLKFFFETSAMILILLFSLYLLHFIQSKIFSELFSYTLLWSAL